MPNEYRFRGFSKPTYTQVPDEFFDELMVHLSEAEVRVLLYVMRRTFGFKKDADAISINQMVSGITAKDGTVLDHGCGLGRTAVKKGVAGLTEKGVLSVTKVQAENGEYETNVYSLVFAEEKEGGRLATRGRSRNDPPLGRRVTHPRSRRDLRVGRQVTPQETVEQHTGLQETAVEDSNGHQPLLMISVNDRLVIERYVKDFARELNDQAPLISSVTRACRLYVESGLELGEFADRMIEARRRTQQHSGGIRAEPTPGRATKPKIAYWFATLESLVSPKP